MCKRKKNRIRNRIAWGLVLVMVLQVFAGMSGTMAQAVDLTRVDNIFSVPDCNNLYEGEKLTLKLQDGTDASKVEWSCTDMDRTYCDWSTSNSGNFYLNALRGTESGSEITVTATVGDTYQNLTLMIYANNEFYFMAGDRITSGIDVEEDNNMYTRHFNLELLVDSEITLKTNQKTNLTFSGNNNNVNVTGNSDGYKISNEYTKEGQKSTNPASPVRISSSYSIIHDGHKHDVVITLDLHVIDRLTLNDTHMTIRKGTEERDATAKLTASPTYKNSEISWKVYEGELTADEALTSVDKEVTQYFTIQASTSVGESYSSLHDLATITITKDLILSPNVNDRIYTIVATQTAYGERAMNAVCYVTVLQPVTDLQLTANDATLYLTGGGADVSTTVTAQMIGDAVNGVEADDKKIVWSCTDETVATIAGNDNACRIYAQKPGHCVVVAASADNPNASDVIYIEVVPKVSTVEITSTDMTVNLAEQYVQLFANVQSNAVDEQIDTDDYETYLNALNKTVIWSSSNTNVATVDMYTGKVLLHSAGRVTITCASADDQKIADSIVLTINVPVASISLQDNFKKISVGESFTLNYTLLSNYPGFEPSNKEVTWESSDSKVATVDNDGKVTGISGGTATILLRADDGQITATCTVEVYQAVSRIDISDTTLDINIGEEAILEAQVYPTTASEQKVLWSSNKPDVVSVSQDGVVTANKVGEPVVVTAYIVDKNATIKTTCIVNVVVPITSISLSPASKTLNKGETVLLTKNITPKDATNATVIYASTNTGVATVDSKGIVTAIAGGSCYITARTQNRDMMTSVYITVNEKVKSVKLNKKSKVMKKGSKYTLKPTVKNSTATNKSLTWSSSNSKVAKVTQKGVVTAKGYGTATITCKSMDGSGKKATCKITVRRYITSIKLSASSMTLQMKKSRTLTAKITPSNASIKKVQWKTSNSRIATVKNGKITAIAPGTCYITCKAADGSGKKARCRVTVKKVLTDDDITGKERTSK